MLCHAPRWYAVLLALRLFVALFSPSYIHPDEYFQSVEITANDIFDLNVNARLLPWELTTKAPIRSILPIYTLSGLPFWLLAKWSGPSSATADQVFWSGRLAAFLLSLAFDMALYHTLNLTHARDPSFHRTRIWHAMLFAASLWPVLVLYSRPTSNLLEAVIVALVLAITLSSTWTGAQSPGKRQAACIGFLAAFGFFCRPTIVAFLAPILLYYLYKRLFIESLRKTWAPLLSLCLGGLFASSACIVVDSLYYSGLMHAIDSQEQHLTWVITPLNFFLYNRHSGNLAQHGLHPRFTHVLVNMCLLFGPLYLSLWKSVCSWVLKLNAGPPRSPAAALCVATIVTSLLSLSLVPHQEPRFLLPLVFPVIYLVTMNYRPTRKLLYLHLLFHSLLLLLFGLLHQGGLSSIMRQLFTILRSPPIISTSTHLLFYKTYMPPTHLLMVPKILATTGLGPVTVTDLAGRLTESELCALLQSRLATDTTTHLIVTLPGFVARTCKGLIWKEVARAWPYLSLDDLTALFSHPLHQSLTLSAYVVTT